MSRKTPVTKTGEARPVRNRDRLLLATKTEASRALREQMGLDIPPSDVQFNRSTSRGRTPYTWSVRVGEGQRELGNELSYILVRASPASWSQQECQMILEGLRAGTVCCEPQNREGAPEGSKTSMPIETTIHEPAVIDFDESQIDPSLTKKRRLKDRDSFAEGGGRELAFADSHSRTTSTLEPAIPGSIVPVAELDVRIDSIVRPLLDEDLRRGDHMPTSFLDFMIRVKQALDRSEREKNAKVLREADERRRTLNNALRLVDETNLQRASVFLGELRGLEADLGTVNRALDELRKISNQQRGSS